MNRIGSSNYSIKVLTNADRVSAFECSPFDIFLVNVLADLLLINLLRSFSNIADIHHSSDRQLGLSDVTSLLITSAPSPKP